MLPSWRQQQLLLELLKVLVLQVDLLGPGDLLLLKEQIVVALGCLFGLLGFQLHFGNVHTDVVPADLVVETLKRFALISLFGVLSILFLRKIQFVLLKFLKNYLR